MINLIFRTTDDTKGQRYEKMDLGFGGAIGAWMY